MNKGIFKKQESAMYGSERLHILQYPGVREFFILCCIGADAFTLFTVFDLLLTENRNITLVITITVAAAMNIIPMLLAACLWNKTLGKEMRRILCGVLITLFTVLFMTTFGLRFASRDLLFQSTAGLESYAEQLSDEVGAYVEDSASQDEDGTTAAQDILAIILGLEPLATSGIAFVLSYETSPYRKQRYINDLSKIELRMEIDSTKMMINELTQDMAFDYEKYDDAGFNVLAAQLRDIAEQDKRRAERLLAEDEATPEAIEYIMEGGWKKDAQKASYEDAGPAEEAGAASNLPRDNDRLKLKESA